ncbi:hypothetical protein SpCBS45565_g06576 [Spizellomyces sp. 'palustris']|nr:hypothetical protein SpCBS45565_g06576 [Spizellomyces sp. 'palustris']
MRKGKSSLKAKLSNSVKSRNPSIVQQQTGSSCSEPKSVQELLWNSRPRGRIRDADENKVVNAYGWYLAHVTPPLRSGTFAGPPPPNGWVPLWKGPRTLTADDLTVACQSLQSLCAEVVAKNLRLRARLAGDLQAIPFHQKENIMKCATGMRDTDLVLFSAEDLTIVALRRSTVTVEGLARFLNVALIVDEEDIQPQMEDMDGEEKEEVVDSWEELEEDDMIPRSMEPVGYSHIHTLDISFNVRMTGVAFAKLITQALPRLFTLKISGCFDQVQGPSTLGILSRKLNYLKELDVSYSSWVTKEVLMCIGWEEWWRSLELLQIVDCGDGVQAVREELKVIRPSLVIRF